MQWNVILCKRKFFFLTCRIYLEGSQPLKLGTTAQTHDTQTLTLTLTLLILKLVYLWSKILISRTKLKISRIFFLIVENLTPTNSANLASSGLYGCGLIWFVWQCCRPNKPTPQLSSDFEYFHILDGAQWKEHWQKPWNISSGRTKIVLTLVEILVNVQLHHS